MVSGAAPTHAPGVERGDRDVTSTGRVAAKPAVATPAGARAAEAVHGPDGTAPAKPTEQSTSREPGPVLPVHAAATSSSPGDTPRDVPAWAVPDAASERDEIELRAAEHELAVPFPAARIPRIPFFDRHVVYLPAQDLRRGTLQSLRPLRQGEAPLCDAGSLNPIEVSQIGVLSCLSRRR
jgi:hypothetical protein